MFNNMENRDLILNDENKQEEKRKKGIWIILLYIIIILFLMVSVFITSSHFLNATIKPNEIIVPDDNEIIEEEELDKDDQIIDSSHDNNKNDYTPSKDKDDEKDKDNIFSDIFDDIFDKDPELRITFTEQEDTKIRLYETYPVSENKALASNDKIKFTIKNGSVDANYKISIRDIVDDSLAQQYNNKRISHNKLNYYLKNITHNKEFKGKISDLDILESYICTDTIKEDEIVEYSLIIWIDENAGNAVQNSYYTGKLYVDVEGA